MADRLTLIGTAGEIRAKIERLAAAGVTQVCLYISIVEPEFHFSTLETYGREILPRSGDGARPLVDLRPRRRLV